MEAKTIKMGSLYIDGKAMPVNCDECNMYDGKSYDITIGNSVEGKKITWVWVEEISVWIADRGVLCNISGIDLLQAGFIPGKVVEIDGRQFYCRLLRMMKDNVSGLNELYFAKKETYAGAPLWSFETECFWCDEVDAGSPFNRPVVNLAQSVSACVVRYPESTRNENIHFRPVLEPAQDGKKLFMDDTPFSFRLPDGGSNSSYGTKRLTKWSEWGRAVQSNDKAKWTGSDTLCRNFAKDLNTGKLMEKAVLRGGLDVLSWDKTPLATRERVGFRPVMVPLLKNCTEMDIFDPSVFSGIRDGTEIKMYTLMLDGNPIKVTGEVTPSFNLLPKTKISFTDEYYGDDYLLSWIMFEGKAISKFILLQFVSWADLAAQGFCERKMDFES